MHGLLTDLYQLTMAAGYCQAGKAGETATFELFVRHLPVNRNYVLTAGLAQAVDYLLNLSFSPDEIQYLRGLPQFSQASEDFFQSLTSLRFTGNLDAVPEGTPVFPGEPIVTVRAPLIEAQIAETYLLSMIGFQSLVATKAARLVEAAGGRGVVEFGTRRAHSPEAGVLAGRAAYIGGCLGTSNVETGIRYGVPVFGTAAHSWVLSFASELESFRELQQLLGEGTIYLIDSYDTLRGAQRAASLGKPIWGVRLDSGNLVELTQAVRLILDDSGLPDAKIMVTGDLNEYKILELVKEGLPIQAFGVGTELATSADAPTLGAVYKLVELESGGEKRYTAKFSDQKHTMPGAKQVFRYRDSDLVGCSWENPEQADAEHQPERLLRPVIRRGGLVGALPEAKEARERATACRNRLPSAYRSLFSIDPPYRVEQSAELRILFEKARREVMGIEK